MILSEIVSIILQNLIPPIIYNSGYILIWRFLYRLSSGWWRSRSLAWRSTSCSSITCVGCWRYTYGTYWWCINFLVWYSVCPILECIACIISPLVCIHIQYYWATLLNFYYLAHFYLLVSLVWLWIKLVFTCTYKYIYIAFNWIKLYVYIPWRVFSLKILNDVITCLIKRFWRNI